MLLALAIIAAVTSLTLAVVKPSWRRTMLWGAIWASPLVGFQIAIAGSLTALGISVPDAWLVLGLLIVTAAGISSLLAVAASRYIHPWLSSSAHRQRAKLWWWASGAFVALITGLFGVPWSIGLMAGLAVNLALMAWWQWALVWEALVAAYAFGGWYVVAYLFIRQPVASQFQDSFLGAASAGLTINGVPLDELLVIGLIGAIIGPLYAATKFLRTPSHPRKNITSGRTIGVIATVTMVIAATVFWLGTILFLPPALKSISPVGEIGATTTVFQFTFTRPVDRDAVTVIFNPPVEGSWNFADATTATHGFRQANYRLATSLRPGTTYQMSVTNIQSLWGLAGDPVTWTFTTPVGPDITKIDGPLPFGIGGTVEPPDPCQPWMVELTGANDGSSEYTFNLDPATPITVTYLTNRAAYQLTPQPCFASQTVYRLTVQRREVVRDADTGEVVEASNPAVILETQLQVGPNRGSTAAGIGGGPAQVLGEVSAASGTFTPVRPQKILKIAQDYQDRPLSCEAAALKMALAGKGKSVSEQQILNYIGFDRTPRRRGVWGDPNQAFVGDIAGRQNITGYGVHWDPIARAAKKWRPVKVLQSASIRDLTAAIDRGSAVVIWGTIGRAWRDDWRTRTGQLVRAWKGEHARTLIGYIGTANNPTSFVINDPVVGRLTWSVATLTANWRSFGNSGVVVD